jgi:hypothetical protein
MDYFNYFKEAVVSTAAQTVHDVEQYVVSLAYLED